MSGEHIPNPSTKKYLLEIPNEKEVKKRGKNFVKVVITDKATSLEDFYNYIKKHWPNIRFFLDNKNRRKRSPKYADRDAEIVKLNSLPIATLYRMAGLTKANRV